MSYRVLWRVLFLGPKTYRHLASKAAFFTLGCGSPFTPDGRNSKTPGPRRNGTVAPPGTQHVADHLVPRTLRAAIRTRVRAGASSSFCNSPLAPCRPLRSQRFLRCHRCRHRSRKFCIARIQAAVSTWCFRSVRPRRTLHAVMPPLAKAHTTPTPRGPSRPDMPG